jgi:hypothetical protein
VARAVVRRPTSHRGFRPATASGGSHLGIKLRNMAVQIPHVGLGERDPPRERRGVTMDFDRARNLFVNCSAGFLFGSLRELVIVLRDSEHYFFRYGIAHILCERANFLRPHAPIATIVPVQCGHLNAPRCHSV